MFGGKGETDTHHLQLAMGDFGSGMDGIYRLSVHAADLAGNDDEEELFFTVNRNGVPLMKTGTKRFYQHPRKSLFMRTIWMAER